MQTPLSVSLASGLGRCCYSWSQEQLGRGEPGIGFRSQALQCVTGLALGENIRICQATTAFPAGHCLFLELLYLFLARSVSPSDFPQSQPSLAQPSSAQHRPA